MKRRLIPLFVLIMILSATTVCYGDNTEKFKYDLISVSFPSSWEIVNEEDEMESVAEGTDFSWLEIEDLFIENDMIFFASKGSESSKMWLQLRYLSSPETEGYSIEDTYSYTKSELKEFHDTYGDEIIEDLTGSMDRDLVIKESVYENDTDCYIKVTLKNESRGKEDIIYYMPREGSVVAFIAGGSKKSLTKKETSELEKSIISTFSDDGYYDYLSGDESEGMEDYDDFPVDTVTGIIVAVIVFLIYRVRKTMAENGYTGVDGAAQAVETIISDIKGKFNRGDNGTSVSRPAQPKKKSTTLYTPANGQQRDRKTNSLPEQKRDSTSSRRYMESLKSLLDSGLLTREEYNEMVAKYKNRR